VTEKVTVFGFEPRRHEDTKICIRSCLRVFVVITLASLVVGCTSHPEGEKQQRDLAKDAEQPFQAKVSDRSLPALPENPTPDELVHYAWLASPQIEQKFWEWKSAIEQIPQDGTQPTNLAITGGVPITNGSTALNKTTLTLSNDPMADILWPSKPTVSAQRSLEMAKAAGFRFQQAKLDLRQKVLAAYYEYAATAEVLRLQLKNLQLMKTSAVLAESGIASGTSTQSQSLRTRNEVDMMSNEISELESKLQTSRAELNASLGRDPAAPLAAPSSLPAVRSANVDAQNVLAAADKRNLELSAIDAESASKSQSVRLAKMQWVPDFALSASTDLGGVMQNLSGMITVPLLRYQAINAAIAQAEANLRAADAMRRSTAIDLHSKIISDIAVMQDAHRQITLLETSLIPRTEAVVRINQMSYESGKMSAMDVIDSQRSLTALQRISVTLKVMHEERLIELETIVGKPLAE